MKAQHFIRAIAVPLVGISLGIGLVSNCQGVENDATSRLQVAGRWLAEAAKEVQRIPNGEDRNNGLYRLAISKAMLGDIEGAKGIAAAILDCKSEVSTCRFIAEIQAGYGDRKGAGKTLILAKPAALSVSSEEDAGYLTSLAIAQARIGELQAAEETLELVKDAHAREFTQVTMAQYYPERDRLRIISNIKDPFYRDLATQDVVASSASSGEMDAAWATAKDIANLNLRTSAYIGIAEAEVRKGNIIGSRRAYERAKATADQIRGGQEQEGPSDDSFIRPVKGDEEFQEIVTSQVRTGNVDEARITVLLIKEPRAKAKSLIEISLALSKKSDRQGAMRMLNEVMHLRSDSEYNTDFMQKLAVALAAADDLQAAGNTVSLMGDYSECKAHAYEDIIDVLIKQSKLGIAKDTADLIVDARWKATSLARIGVALHLAGDITSAKETFSKAVSNAVTASEKNAESYTWTRSTVLSFVAMKQAKVGEFDEINRWVPLVLGTKNRAWSWLGAADALAQQNYDNRRQDMRKIDQGGTGQPDSKPKDEAPAKVEAPTQNLKDAPGSR